MKTKNTLLQTFYRILFVLFLPLATNAQQANAGSNYKVGDWVEADYMGWYPGKIVEVQSGGSQYKVELHPPNGGKAFLYTFLKSRLRPLKGAPKIETPDTTKLVYGKYGCTASSWHNGDVQYTPKGSFVITPAGKYSYLGFEKPSNGTFTVDKAGNLWFSGGYFNGGKAEKIDRPNKFFLTFPANPDNRWTCGLVE